MGIIECAEGVAILMEIKSTNATLGINEEIKHLMLAGM
jgi:hypothetical protein